jgi:PTH1 family peptidyl-tRNA hydrolase
VKLIIGLGNPGSKYEGTRHNVGFEVVDELARRLRLEYESSPADAVMAKERGPNAQVILVKPLTFMNRSGHAVGELARYYRIVVSDLLIVTDDANLPLGRLRARPAGSAGGHNGLGSVIDLLATDQVPRLRVGVGNGDQSRDLADHVLAGFDESEVDIIREAVVRAADAVELFVRDGIEQTMNHFNQIDSMLDPLINNGVD